MKCCAVCDRIRGWAGFCDVQNEEMGGVVFP